MTLKGKIETFTGPAPKRFGRILDDPVKGRVHKTSLSEGDSRLNDSIDSAPSENMENTFNNAEAGSVNEGMINPAFDAMSEGGSSPQQKTTIVSFVIDEQEPRHYNTNSRILDKQGNAATVLMSVLYAIVLTLIGTLYSICEALRGGWLNPHVVGVFEVYLFMVSTIFLVYLQVELYLHNKKVHRHIQNPVTKPSSTGTEATTDKQEDKGAMPTNMLVYRRRPVPNMDEDARGLSLQMPGTGVAVAEDGPSISSDALDLSEEIYEELSFQTQTASLSHETASIYLRLGALLFGIGNFVLVALQFYFGQQGDGDCQNTPQIYPMICQLVFLIVQTFFILKHTHVHITERKGLARFGLMHVLATNLCVWLRILVKEVQAGVVGHHSAGIHGMADYVSNKTNGTQGCGTHGSLLDQASPFLFPCVLEYSLITVAVMAGMFEGLFIRVSQDVIEMIRKTLRLRTLKEHQAAGHHNELHSGHKSMFDKSHRGLYLGVLVLTGVIISIVLFFYNLNTLHHQGTAMNIFHITDISIHATLIVAVILALVRFFKLHFTLSRNNTIDDRLLILSFAGLFLFEGFIMFSSIASLVYDKNMSQAQVIQTWLAVLACSLNIVQALLQTIFVIDGLQRCSVRAEDRRMKPGRGYVTFLLISNVALWIFKTFQVKEVGLSTQESYYGSTPWAIILNMNLPLMLFFRFHSSVCMADIWTSAYENEHNELGLQVLH